MNEEVIKKGSHATGEKSGNQRTDISRFDDYDEDE